jgi:hypothetical protein
MFRDDTYQMTFVVHDGQAADLIKVHLVDGIAQSIVWLYRHHVSMHQFQHSHDLFRLTSALLAQM